MPFPDKNAKPLVDPVGVTARSARAASARSETEGAPPLAGLRNASLSALVVLGIVLTVIWAGIVAFAVIATLLSLL